MNKWEYQIIEQVTADGLNKAGSEGWEAYAIVLQVVPEKAYPISVAYLKRALEPIEVTIVGDAVAVTVEHLPPLKVETPQYGDRGEKGGITEYIISVDE